MSIAQPHVLTTLGLLPITALGLEGREQLIAIITTWRDWAEQRVEEVRVRAKGIADDPDLSRPGRENRLRELARRSVEEIEAEAIRRIEKIIDFREQTALAEVGPLDRISFPADTGVDRVVIEARLREIRDLLARPQDEEDATAHFRLASQQIEGHGDLGRVERLLISSAQAGDEQTLAAAAFAPALWLRLHRVREEVLQSAIREYRIKKNPAAWAEVEGLQLVRRALAWDARRLRSVCFEACHITQTAQPPRGDDALAKAARLDGLSAVGAPEPRQDDPGSTTPLSSAA